MRIKKYFLLCLSSVLLFTGCSGGSGGSSSTVQSDSINSTNGVGFASNSESKGVDSYDGEDFDVNESEDVSESSSTSDIDNIDSENQIKSNKIDTDMLVYRANMTIDTLEYEDSLKNFKELLTKYDGFIETENYSDNGSTYDYYYIEDSDKHSSYTATVRVPSKNYDAFLESIGEIGDVRSKSSNVENMTREYNDIETALEIYKEQEKRYISMIKDADESYALQLQQQLTDLQIKIAQYETRKSTIETDVAYSYVDVTIKEVKKYSLHGKTNTFMMRLKDNFSGSWESFRNVLEGILTFIIYVWYYVIIVIVIVILVRKRAKKKRAERKAKGLPEYPVANKVYNLDINLGKDTNVEEDKDEDNKPEV